MPLELRPLFRPDLVRSRMRGFELPPDVVTARAQLLLWTQWLDTPEVLTAAGSLARLCRPEPVPMCNAPIAHLKPSRK